MGIVLAPTPWDVAVVSEITSVKGLAPCSAHRRSQRMGASFLLLAISPQGLRQKSRPKDEVTLAFPLPPETPVLCLSGGGCE